MINNRQHGIWLAAAFLIALGLFMRAWGLHRPLLWVDEAESSINALTILEHGVPVDHYLGLPIYENTLIQPWPEHPEYEFKDISYSGRGLAIYHGWLPLYSIAAVFKLTGIQPDQVQAAPTAKHSSESAPLRTLAPRVPAIFFSAIYLLFMFLLARDLFGDDAGLAALAAGAFKSSLVEFGRSARYYSATLAISTLCAWLIWRIGTRGRWRDVILCGLSMILLFHTHSLSFLILGLLLFATVVARFKYIERVVLKGLAFCAIVFLGVFPWMLFVGYFNAAEKIPPAWTVLDFPYDFISFAYNRLLTTALIGFGVVLLAAGIFYRDRLPERWTRPFVENKGAFLFALAWMSIAFLIFTLLIPAASYFVSRLSLVVTTPAWILVAMIAAALFRVFLNAPAPIKTAAAVTLLLLVSGRMSFDLPGNQPYRDFSMNRLRMLEQWDLEPQTKCYAAPNHQLILSYYSGMPFQSIAPVRKEFLNNYSGDIVYFQSIPFYSNLPERILRPMLEAEGYQLDEEDIKHWQNWISALLAADKLRDMAGEVQPDLVPRNELEKRLMREQIVYTRTAIRKRAQLVPALRETRMYNWQDYWNMFFYRFSDYQSRWRENANYADLIENSRACIMPWGVVLFDCTEERNVVVPQTMKVQPPRELGEPK